MRCPVCSGWTYTLGELGSLTWYRCQNCGMEFPKPTPQEDDILADIEGLDKV